MSGGAFDYAYIKALHFAEDLEDNLLKSEPYYEPLNEEVKENLHKIVDIVNCAASLMKETEWLFSSDIGEDTFLQRVNVTLNSLYKLHKVE